MVYQNNQLVLETMCRNRLTEKHFAVSENKSACPPSKYREICCQKEEKVDFKTETCLSHLRIFVKYGR